MSTSLTFGNGATCVLESSHVTHMRPKCDRSFPTSQVHEQVRSALADPLNYPSLASATVPGDRFVLAIEYGIPCPLQVIEGALVALRDAGVESSDATLLLSHGFSQEKDLHEQIARLADSHEITLDVHNPKDERCGAILGVTKAGRPLRLNRVLCDADLVLSLGVCPHQSDTDERRGTFSGLFPIFSDQETIDHYRAPIAADSKVIRAERCNEIDEAGWLLGVGMTVQVVPSPSEGIAAVFAGEPEAVAKSAADEYRRIWSCRVDHPGDLVIVTVTGGPSQQTWENVAHALQAAERVAETGGAIAIYSDFVELPGPSLQRLAGMEGSLEVEREIMRDRFSDSWSALCLCRALERGPVYFRSRLSSGIVESLGLAPLETDEELARLVSNSKNCIAIDGAQRLMAAVVSKGESGKGKGEVA